MFNKFADWLQKYLQPVAAKLSQSVIIQSITQGMMGLLVITVGVCVVSILVNLPFQPWLDFLNNVGLTTPAKELVSATSSLLGIYTVISVSYAYAKNAKQDPKANVLITTAVFIALMPQTITVGESSVSALATSNLGSNGIFVGILLGIVVPMFYNFLIKHNVTIKMPQQVPPMVSEAMTPIIAAMVIFTVTLLVKWGFTLTPFNNVFSLFYDVVTTPLMAIFGTTILTPILYCVIRSLFWFFGIHPSPVNAVYLPLSNAAIAANVEAALAGEPLPYLLFTIIVLFGMMGGTGGTLGLNLCMLKAKSERYKALNKVALIPGLFNINEPLVFGVPIMFNPMMLIPTILGPIAGALVAAVFVGTGLINDMNFNAAVSVAWVVPNPIAAFLRGGIVMLIALLIALVIQTLIFYPFFKVLDNQALAEEQANAENAQ